MNLQDYKYDSYYDVEEVTYENVLQVMDALYDDSYGGIDDTRRHKLFEFKTEGLNEKEKEEFKKIAQIFSNDEFKVFFEEEYIEADKSLEDKYPNMDEKFESHKFNIYAKKVTSDTMDKINKTTTSVLTGEEVGTAIEEKAVKFSRNKTLYEMTDGSLIDKVNANMVILKEGYNGVVVIPEKLREDKDVEFLLENAEKYDSYYVYETSQEAIEYLNEEAQTFMNYELEHACRKGDIEEIRKYKENGAEATPHAKKLALCHDNSVIKALSEKVDNDKKVENKLEKFEQMEFDF